MLKNSKETYPMPKKTNRDKNRKKRPVWPVIIPAALVLLLAGCQKKEEADPGVTAEVAVSDAEKADNFYYYTAEHQSCYDSLQAEMEEQGCGFAAACLGRAPELKAALDETDPDLAKADELLKKHLENSGLNDRYSFLSIIHSYRIREIGDGDFLYVVIPDQNAEGMDLCELKEDGEAGAERGSCTARVKGAYPLLILTDRAWIEEENGRGCILKISGDTADGEEVLSLNRYSGEVSLEELTGTWLSSGAADDAGGEFDLYLNIKGERNADFWYTYPGESEPLLHYQGTMEEQGDRRFVFHMMSDSGLFKPESVPAMPLEGIYRMSFGDEEGTKLLVSRISGDPLFTGIIDGELLFAKTEEVRPSEEQQPVPETEPERILPEAEPALPETEQSRQEAEQTRSEAD